MNLLNLQTQPAAGPGFEPGPVVPVVPLKDGCEPSCRGCHHRGLSAHQSEAHKQAWLLHKLAPWRDRFAPLQALPEPERWHYRDKLCLTCDWSGTGWQFGLMNRQRLIPIPRCPVHSERAQRRVQLLLQGLPAKDVFPLAFYVQASAQVTLILKTAHLPSSAWLDKRLRQALAATGLEGLWLHLHPAAGKRLFTKNGWHLLWGRPRSRTDTGLVYGPSAFQQLISKLYQRALDEAEVFLAPGADNPMVDLYCGSGSTLSRWLRRSAPTVGVELGGEAVAYACENAPQALVLRGKCAHRLPQLTAWLGEYGRAADQSRLYVNPPRTGLEPEVVEWIISTCHPRRMAYLSCSAGTLRRDLEQLTAAGYQVTRITPYDFFPQTQHVETLVLLQG